MYSVTGQRVYLKGLIEEDRGEREKGLERKKRK